MDPGGPSPYEGGADDPAPPALHRSSSVHLVGGVAGGLAERFDIDVSIVRVAFVVAACVWGVGAVIYLAMWALVPLDHAAEAPTGPEGSLDATAGAPSSPPRSTYVLLTGALFLGVMISSLWWGGPQLGGGLGLGWLVLLFLVVVVALRRPTRRTSFARVLLTLTLVLLSCVILAVGAFFGAMATTGVPLTGGIGQRVIQPTSAAQLDPVYRLAAGSLTLDLTHVPLGSSTHRITTSVGVGQLVIDVPSTAIVDIDAHSGIGTVSYGSSGATAFSTVDPATNPFGTARPQLVISAQVGIGNVQLERSGS